MTAPLLVLIPLLYPAPSPTNCQIADRLRECPPANDPAPFLRSPRLDLIGPCKEAATGDGCATAGGKTWSHVFHRAARFPQPRFGQCREPLESDGLLIYEGMKLTVDPATGVYDLTFTATAPPTPVTVRLQLQFWQPGNYDQHSQFEPIRLTLPPIRIEPDPRVDIEVGTTLRVNHRGYSELFLKEERSKSSTLRTQIWGDPPHINGPDGRWHVVRAGTARFGSGQDRGDDPTR